MFSCRQLETCRLQRAVQAVCGVQGEHHPSSPTCCQKGCEGSSPKHPKPASPGLQHQIYCTHKLQGRLHWGWHLPLGCSKLGILGQSHPAAGLSYKMFLARDVQHWGAEPVGARLHPLGWEASAQP